MCVCVCLGVLCLFKVCVLCVQAYRMVLDGLVVVLLFVFVSECCLTGVLCAVCLWFRVCCCLAYVVL